MKKYKIVTNGNYYKVQKKQLPPHKYEHPYTFNKWINVVMPFCNCDGYLTKRGWDTLIEAKKHIKILIKEDNSYKNEDNWKEVII